MAPEKPSCTRHKFSSLSTSDRRPASNSQAEESLSGTDLNCLQEAVLLVLGYAPPSLFCPSPCGGEQTKMLFLLCAAFSPMEKHIFRECLFSLQTGSAVPRGRSYKAATGTAWERLIADSPCFQPLRKAPLLLSEEHRRAARVLLARSLMQAVEQCSQPTTAEMQLLLDP